MASPNKEPSVLATPPIYLKIKMDDTKLNFPTDTSLVIPDEYVVGKKLPEDKKNLDIPKEINLTELSNKNDLSCKSIDCDNMKKLIKLIEGTIYNDNIMNLINHIRLFIKNIVILDIYLSEVLSITNINKYLESNSSTKDIDNIYSIFSILSSNLKKYNKLNKITKYKVKTPILGSNLYSKLKGKHSKIINEIIYFEKKKEKLHEVLTNNNAKICEFNKTILTTIYNTINELLIANILRDTKEIKLSDIKISISKYASATNEMIEAPIISINLKNLTFKYKNTDSKIETSSFADLCTQKIEKTTCLDTDTKKSIIGPISNPPNIPLSGCNQKTMESRHSSNSGSSSKSRKSTFNDDGTGVVAGASASFNLLSSIFS